MTWRLIRPIWHVDNITASQRLVLLALASFTDQRGANAYPSQATLARMCCCSTRTVRRALADLIALKMIVPNGKGRGGTIRYAVNVLPTPDTHGRLGRSPMSYNPSKEIPSKRNPSKRDSDSYSNSPGLSGDSSVRRFRRTREELSEEHARKRAAGQALIAGNHRP
jgi:hypothetical protein